MERTVLGQYVRKKESNLGNLKTLAKGLQPAAKNALML